MNNLRDKLEHFNNEILRDAAAERDRILDRTRAQLEEHVNREKAKFQEQADELYKQEAASVENTRNNMVSRAIIDSRLLLIKKREEILETVLTDAKKAIEEYISGEDYLPYLVGLIKESCGQAGAGELIVYITAYDLSRFSSVLDGLRSEFPGITSFTGSDEDFIGGCRVLNRTTDMVVNNTLAEKLKAGMEYFFEVCDLKIV